MNSLELPLESGGSVTVELVDSPYAAGADPYGGSFVTRGGMTPEAAAERAEQTFESSLGTVRNVAESVLAQLDGLRLRPESVTVEFGIALAAKAGAIVTAGATAHFQISVTWNPGPS
ncbi:CU044_2847 family protein [Streptomyces sp. HUAS ZL42]|uniref:CU044_2847 family protein n=1 Tax=Streptomyces sp. HUAS ZL42 TaxID=3231715 RepID=UPI00345E7BF4